MKTETPVPETLSRLRSRMGKIGGAKGSRKDKVRAGHARQAQLLRRLAKHTKIKEEAAELVRRAIEQEKKAE